MKNFPAENIFLYLYSYIDMIFLQKYALWEPIEVVNDTELRLAFLVKRDAIRTINILPVVIPSEAFIQYI
jgi:hypothetical protein